MNNKFLDKLLKTYIYILIIGMPLFFDNGYFNMLTAKQSFFIKFSIIFLTAIFVGKFAEQCRKNDNKYIDLNFADVLVLVFMSVVIIGTFCSNNIMTTILGKNGWGLGTLFIIINILVFLTISINQIFSKKMIVTILVVALVVCCLGIINALGGDPIGIMRELKKDEYGKYLSTIGNIDWYGEYCAVIHSMSVVCYFEVSNENNNHTQYMILSLICSLISYSASILSGSDCGMTGIVISTIYIFILMLKTGKKNKKLYIYLAAICIINFVLKTIIIRRCIIEIGVIQNTVISYINLIIIGWWIINKFNNMKEKGIVLGVIIIIAICTFNEELFNRIQELKAYFIFNDSWGTYRGHIWSYSVKMFDKMNIQGKLFGNGLDSFGDLAKKYFYEDLYTFFGKKIVNAHNNFLQLLITTGIVGTMSYYLFNIWIIAVGIKTNIYTKIMTMGVVTYIVQGIFNNFQPLGVVYMCILYALINSEIKSETREI